MRKEGCEKCKKSLNIDLMYKQQVRKSWAVWRADCKKCKSKKKGNLFYISHSSAQMLWGEPWCQSNFVWYGYQHPPTPRVPTQKDFKWRIHPQKKSFWINFTGPFVLLLLLSIPKIFSWSLANWDYLWLRLSSLFDSRSTMSCLSFTAGQKLQFIYL